MTNYRYSISIQWSEADKLFLVTIPEFADRVMQPCTAGKTYRDAIAAAIDCIESLLDYWQQEGIDPPVSSDTCDRAPTGIQSGA